MTVDTREPPEGAPEEVFSILKDCTDRQLRAIVDYAQQLLRDHPSLTEAVDSRPGEELVRVADHGAYTIAIVERPDETGEARGPFAYRVRWEPSIEGDAGKYRWHYLGRVNTESEGT